MPLLGSAVTAMWCDIKTTRLREFDDWHVHEHFPERLSISGFLRGTRWQSRDDESGCFTMYELSELAVFSSPAYLERLNQPTAWSVSMMSAIRNMVRSPCRISAGAGAGVGGELLTLRLAPKPGCADALRRWLSSEIVAPLQRRPGVVGVHLLETDPSRPAEDGGAQTAEQRLRGGDSVADWALLVFGCDRVALDALRNESLRDENLVEFGAAASGIRADRYRLKHVMTPADLPASN